MYNILSMDIISRSHSQTLYLITNYDECTRYTIRLAVE